MHFKLLCINECLCYVNYLIFFVEFWIIDRETIKKLLTFDEKFCIFFIVQRFWYSQKFSFRKLNLRRKFTKLRNFLHVPGIFVLRLKLSLI